MSDQPGKRHHSAKSAPNGGWFVPADAPANPAPSSATPSGPPMPTNESPQQAGGWFIPPGAHKIEQAESLPAAAEAAPNPLDNVDSSTDPVPAPVAADQSAQAEAAAPTVQPPVKQSIATDEPGAALSSEVDYNNYVPGKGFVQPGAQAASQEPQTTGSAPILQPTGVQLPISQPVASSANEPPIIQQPVVPLAPLKPTPAAAPLTTSAPASGGLSSAQFAASLAAAPVNESLIQRFGDVEQSVQILRRKYTAGSLTGDQLRAELRKLMILDDTGSWWMIGMETDRWYKYNGKDWVQATPPGRAPIVEDVPSPAMSQPATMTNIPAANPMPLTATIPLDEYGMPLPQRVPIDDMGATMVGKSTPYLDNTLRSGAIREPAFDSGATIPSAAVSQDDAMALTQPSAAVLSPAYAPADGVGIPSPAPVYQPGDQPDYGEKPTSIVADRHRVSGCIVRLAIVGVFLALAVTLVVVVGAVLGYYSVVQQYDAAIAALPTTANNTFQTTRILDAAGNVLAEINDPNGGRRVRVSLSQISPYLVHATVATENQHFFQDPGFDILAIARAAFQNLVARQTVSGASTITQQLARALVFDPNTVSSSSVGRKLIEVVVASEIGRRYTKDQILEMYLNQIPYGNFSYGIEAASETYFNKHASDLNLAESSLLAGLPQSPATYDPVQNRTAAFNRMGDVLQRMIDTGCLPITDPTTNQQPLCITQATLNSSVVQLSMVKAATFRPPANNYVHPHFVNYVLQELEQQYGADAIYKAGFTVHTTLDPAIQTAAEQAVTDQVTKLAARHVTNGAVLSVRPSDGAILAMVGSADFNNKDISGQVNIVLAPRQPGSSIKPFVYLTAFTPAPDGSYLTPGSVLWDVKSCFGDNQDYCPVNYDGRFHGPRTVRETLANSYNIPAVKALQYDTVDRFKAIADQAGIRFPLTQPDAAGLATALGGVEVSMYDMVRGYSMLANQGKRLDGLYAISKITKSNNGVDQVVYDAKDHPVGQSQVADPGLTYLITSILSDNSARLPAFGAGNSLQLAGNRPAAAKTGTTNDFRDNWTLGYTANDVVVGVWVGNADNTPMINIEGITGAGPIWNAVMTAATKNQPIKQFPVPGNVGQTTICADFGTADFAACKNRRQEVFVAAEPPPKIDSLLVTAPVDQFSGLIANGNCPDYVQQQTFLKTSDQSAITWLNNDPTGQQWAQSRGLTVPIAAPPTAQCDATTARPVVKLASPQPNQTLNGLIQITGSVNSIPNFSYYQLELAQAANPNAIAQLAAPVRSQSAVGNDTAYLGGWDTSNVPDGQYILRLRAFDSQNHSVLKTVPVIVNNTSAPVAPVAPVAPTPDNGGFGGFPTLPPQQNIAPTSTSPGASAPGGAPTLRPLFPPTASR